MLADPVVTLVTPCWNAREYLAETIASVLGQDYPNIEYLVMDGGSTDGTVELLREYGERVHWRSERDEGAADALRKGFERASGQILGWINADDTLLPGAVTAAVEAISRAPEAVLAFGEADWVDEDGAVIRPYPVAVDAQKKLGSECLLCQPACFFMADAYRRAGGIDASLQYAFDWELWMRLAREGAFRHVPRKLAHSRMHASNKTLSGRRGVFDEGMRVLQRHYGYVPFQWVYSYRCWLRDGRDQYFEPLEPSTAAWLASLPEGLKRNPSHPFRYAREWAAVMSLGGLARRLRSR